MLQWNKKKMENILTDRVALYSSFNYLHSGSDFSKITTNF